MFTLSIVFVSLIKPLLYQAQFSVLYSYLSVVGWMHLTKQLPLSSTHFKSNGWEVHGYIFFYLCGSFYWPCQPLGLLFHLSAWWSAPPSVVPAIITILSPHKAHSRWGIWQLFVPALSYTIMSRIKGHVLISGGVLSVRIQGLVLIYMNDIFF